MLEDLTLSGWNFLGNKEADDACKPRVLSDDDADQRRELLLGTILLNRAKKVAPSTPSESEPVAAAPAS